MIRSPNYFGDGGVKMAHTTHRTGTQAEWFDARLELLKREKELTRLSDDIARERRALPWVPVEKRYRFHTNEGEKGLEDLFAGRSQLLVYHFMFGPDWEAGCPSCSFLADEVDGGIVHLNQRDVTMTFVSRAPLEKLNAYKERMGWGFDWVSSHGSDFNFDYGVSFTDEQRGNGADYNFRREENLNDELPGLTAFALHADTVHHTYSARARGLDILDNVYQLLDRAPLGRNEETGDDWVRRHDEYGQAS
jgi:predicted dithiol-disulfide oxidoreductase (DUF899 family)